MSIAAIGAVSPTAAAGYLPETSAVGASGATGFGSQLTGAIDGLQATTAESKDLAIKAVTGDLTDIHRATIAAARAQVTLELVAAVRNKGVDAFNEIMRMQA